MDIHSEILRYMGMGHAGAIDARTKELIVSCREKLDAASDPRRAATRLPCTVAGDTVFLDTEKLRIESKELAAHAAGCTEMYLFAATLGAGVDRLIAQRAKIDSAEALCLQACAAARIEEYCEIIEAELSAESEPRGLYLRPRFSPGYGDFDIACQTDILRVLRAHKKIGVSETTAHMLTPLKSVTAVIGIGVKNAACVKDKCSGCGKTDCPFRAITQEVL